MFPILFQVDDVESKLDLLIEMYKEDRRRTQQTTQQLYQQTQQLAQQIGPPLSPGLQLQPVGGNQSMLSPTESLLNVRQNNIKQVSEPPTPVGKNPTRPMHRNLSDLGPRFKKRVTYRCASNPMSETVDQSESYVEEQIPLTPILKKPSRGHSYSDTTGALYGNNCDNRPCNWSVEHLAADTFSEGTFSELQTDSETNLACPSPRDDRYPSCDSTESDMVSEGEQENDEQSQLLNPNPTGGPQEQTTAETYDGELPQNSNYRLRPESQALLMRPEVLKLRKTTC